MNPSALSDAVKVSLNEINRLESSSDSWETLVHIFSILVVAGVVLELVILWREHLDDLEKWRGGIIRAPEKPSTVLLVVGLFGAGLVAVGVAGEVSVGVYIGTLQTRLRAENKKLNDIALKSASDAMLRAAQLEAQIQPRYLSQDQLKSLGSAMRKFSGIGFLITSHRLDTEGRRLALQIKSALNAAGIGLDKGTFAKSTVDRIGQYPDLSSGTLGGNIPDDTIHEGVEVWGTDEMAVDATIKSLAPISARRGVAPSELSSLPMSLAIFVGIKPGADPSGVSAGVEGLKNRALAEQAKAELSELKTPRAMSWSQETFNELSKFPGTPFTLATFEDSDSTSVASSMINGLITSGWEYRVPPGLGVTLGNGRFAFKTTGMGVHINWKPGQASARLAVTEWFERSKIQTTGGSVGKMDTVVPVAQQMPMEIIIGQKTTH